MEEIIVGASHKWGTISIWVLLYTLCRELCEDCEKWFNYFRVSMSSFNELLLRIKDHVKYHDTNTRNAMMKYNDPLDFNLFGSLQQHSLSGKNF